MPRLSRFSMLHPDMDVRLNASVDAVDLSAGQADFHIRYGNFLPAPNVAVIVVGAPLGMAIVTV